MKGMGKQQHDSLHASSGEALSATAASTSQHTTAIASGLFVDHSAAARTLGTVQNVLACGSFQEVVEVSERACCLPLFILYLFFGARSRMCWRSAAFKRWWR